MSRLRATLPLIGLSLGLSMTAPPARAQAPAAAAAAEPAAAIRTGDVVRLRVWREPEFSGEFQVGQEGTAVLPRIGPTPVVHETQESLREKLIATYSRYLTHRSIDVTVLRRVQVIGAVRNPGLYTVEPTMTVSDAVALAGGATAEGRPNRVRLIRDGRVVAGNIVGQTTAGDLRIRSGDQLLVPERNWLSRNPGIVAALITGAVVVVTTLPR